MTLVNKEGTPRDVLVAMVKEQGIDVIVVGQVSSHKDDNQLRAVREGGGVGCCPVRDGFCHVLLWLL